MIKTFTERLPQAAEMTPEQKEASKKLRAIRKQEQPCHREFYDHVIEEKTKQNAASERWRKNRLDWFNKK
jgi:hypothetical protein